MTALSAPLAYDRVATEYERTRPMSVRITDAVARQITALVAEEEWILDAGCGTGRFTRALATHHLRTVGVDAAPAMLAELRRIATEDETPLPLLTISDLRSLPFMDAQFTAILGVHILHLIVDWKQALQEIIRVLAPGGVLLLGYEDRTRSEVRDFYIREGQRRELLPTHPGAQSVSSDVLPVLLNEMGMTDFQTIAPPEWMWERRVSVGEMLSDLSSRLYSPQWNIPESAHEEILQATRANAIAQFGPLEQSPYETQTVRFVLHSVRKA